MRPLREMGAGLAGLIALASCEETVEIRPRVTPRGESLWLLVKLQIGLDAIRPELAAHDDKTFSPAYADRLSSGVLGTTEHLATAGGTDDELRAARFRADLIALGYDVLRAHVVAAKLGVSGAARSACGRAMEWVLDGLEKIEADPLWPVLHPVEANRFLLAAVDHRDNAMQSIPLAHAMKTGVSAAALTSSALSLVRLVQVGLPALARLVEFIRGQGGAPVYLAAELAGGAGSIRAVSGGRALVLTVEEVIALAQAGVMSAAALTVYMAASEVHHICTDKNSTSDQNGGPWIPLFEGVFKKAGMRLSDPENLVRVAGHKGPYPQEYHQLVWDELTSATQDTAANGPAFREAVRRTLARLAKEIQTPGTRLNRLVTEGASE